MNYKFHPLAEIFPLMTDSEIDDLASDIDKNGLTEKIVMHDGKILDGRNRYSAMLKLGITLDPAPPIFFEDFTTHCFDRGLKTSPLKFVISKNLIRRHLSESQRAWAAAQLANMRQGERTDLELTQAITGGEPLADMPKVEKVSAQDAADLFKVSKRMVTLAGAVKKSGVQALQKAVADGAVAVTVADEIARLDRQDQERVMRDNEPARLKHVAKREKRDRRQRDLADKQRALPDKVFGVIYADPPWKFENRNEETGADRSAGNHYPLMDEEKIASLQVWGIAAKDCVLFLWATVPCLDQAMGVLVSWGFVYQSHLVWKKDRIGHGFWSRNNHEILLIGTRGKPVAPAPGTQPPSCQEFFVRGHSRKPQEFREMINGFYPDIAKIELFAREAAPGWERWGKEAPDQSDIEAFLFENDPDNHPDDLGKSGSLETGQGSGRPDLAPDNLGQPGQSKASQGSGKPDLAPDNLGQSGQSKASQGSGKPDLAVVYDGAHTPETDAVIRRGYAEQMPLADLAALLGLSKDQKGIIKGRAHRLGLTDSERVGTKSGHRYGGPRRA